MQPFLQETTDYIAEQFRAFFDRKEKRPLSLKDARTMVDFVSGPAPASLGGSAIDPSKPYVTGGGRPRPSAEQVTRILEKYENTDEDADLWDEVFTELIRSLKEENHKKALRLIKLAFKKQIKTERICEIMDIKSTRTYNNYRLVILTKAGILAIKKGIDLV